MKALVCSNCGAHDWKEVDEYRVCTYCGTRFLISEEEMDYPRTKMALDSDVERLLFCRLSTRRHAARKRRMILSEENVGDIQQILLVLLTLVR